METDETEDEGTSDEGTSLTRKVVTGVALGVATTAAGAAAKKFMGSGSDDFLH